MALVGATRRIALCVVAAAFALSPAAATMSAQAEPGIDSSRAAAHRRGADGCILDAAVIYTDPYIGGRLTHRQVVAAIARMCARSFALYSEDLALDAIDARRLLHQTIEAALRGQFRDSAGTPTPPGDR